MNRLRYLTFALAACTAPLLGQELAQERGFEARINSEFSYDDNFLRQKTAQAGTRVWVVNPGVRYTLETPGTLATASYDFVHTNYLDSRADNYTSHTTNLNIQKKLNDFNKFILDLAYLGSFEARGVGFSEGTNALLLESPTPLKANTISGSYQLGADTARMRVISNYGRRHTNRNSPLITNDSRDFNEDFYGAQLLYRMGWRTDIVGEFRGRSVTYPRTPVAADGSDLPLDSVEQQYLVGVDLRATAKTTGKVRVGTLERDFKWQSVQWEDAPNAGVDEEPQVEPQPIQGPQDTGQDFYWELSAVWAPRTYSSVSVNSRVSTREAMAVGSFIRSKEFSMNWNHQWSSRIQTETSYTVGTDTYVDSDRQDDRQAMELRMRYTLDLWLNLGVGIRYQQLQSTFDNAGFDKWIYYLFVNYTEQRGN